MHGAIRSSIPVGSVATGRTRDYLPAPPVVRQLVLCRPADGADQALETDGTQGLHGVGPQRESATDLQQARRGLVDVHLVASMQQGGRGAQSTKAATYDRYTNLSRHDILPSSRAWFRVRRVYSSNVAWTPATTHRAPSTL